MIQKGNLTCNVYIALLLPFGLELQTNFQTGVRYSRIDLNMCTYARHPSL